MARRLKLTLVAIALIGTTACTRRAVVTSTELQGGNVYTGAWLREELYFGLNMPDGKVVSDSAFDAFTNIEIARRLPEGFTILDAIGYWRSQISGRTERERSRVLIVHYREADREKARALIEVADLYKRTFAQEAVLRVTLPARVQFR